MALYEFIGDVPATFPSLGLELEPGDVVELPEDPRSSLLVETQPKRQSPAKSADDKESK